MLDIRLAEWTTHAPLKLLNPFELRRRLRRAAEAGALANMLHNLALAAAHDFDHFEEPVFWSTHQAFMQRYPGVAEHYVQVFERFVRDGV